MTTNRAFLAKIETRIEALVGGLGVDEIVRFARFNAASAHADAQLAESMGVANWADARAAQEHANWCENSASERELRERAIATASFARSANCWTVDRATHHHCALVRAAAQISFLKKFTNE